MKIFVTATGTDSGKTLMSAILCEALGADYWKPVQAGLPRDTDAVSSLVSRREVTYHPERYALKTPASPHAAARAEGIHIDLADFVVPPDNGRPLVMEGAGGVLVPLNDDHLMIDLIARLGAPTIVVSNHYLGSINHTLLTMAALQQKGVTVKGIVFNGETNAETERIILRHTGLPCLLRIHRERMVDKEVVKKYASAFNDHWNR